MCRIGREESRPYRVGRGIANRLAKCGILTMGDIAPRRLADIVNYIRLNESDFVEWHQSETAKLLLRPHSVTRRKPPATSFNFYTTRPRI